MELADHHGEDNSFDIYHTSLWLKKSKIAKRGWNPCPIDWLFCETEKVEKLKENI